MLYALFLISRDWCSDVVYKSWLFNQRVWDFISLFLWMKQIGESGENPIEYFRERKEKKNDWIKADWMKQPKERSIKSVVLIVRIKKTKNYFYYFNKNVKKWNLKMNEELIEKCLTNERWIMCNILQSLFSLWKRKLLTNIFKWILSI